MLNERVRSLSGIGDRLKTTAGTFELWDISADRKLPPVFHEPNGVRAIAACPAKKFVAWATGHRKVRVLGHHVADEANGLPATGRSVPAVRA